MSNLIKENFVEFFVVGPNSLSSAKFDLP